MTPLSPKTLATLQGLLDKSNEYASSEWRTSFVRALACEDCDHPDFLDADGYRPEMHVTQQAHHRALEVEIAALRLLDAPPEATP